MSATIGLLPAKVAVSILIGLVFPSYVATAEVLIDARFSAQTLFFQNRSRCRRKINVPTGRANR